MPKIMLAEDDTTMISLLETLLKMEGYQVHPLDSDADIIAAVLKDKPDILLMDIHLLHQNGMDVLVKLRATAGGNGVRVVMASGLDFRDQCMARGANAFIQKPYTADDLLLALRAVA